MSKRYFKIETGRYGGEVVCGAVTPEFYEYWVDRDIDDLISAMYSDGEDDPDSPKPCEGDEEYWTAWYDIDNFVHLSAPYADNSYRVCEISLKEGVTFDEEWGGFETSPEWTEENGYTFFNELTEWEDMPEHDYIAIASQELYASKDKFGEEGTQPVLFFHSAEKGAFGEVVVVTDGEDFNPAKFRVDCVETEVGEFIMSYWYDKKNLPINYDWSDSTGKGTYAWLGVLDTEDHEKYFKPLEEGSTDLEDYWEADEDVL